MTLPVGDLVSKAHVTAVITRVLQRWLPYYLAEACRAHALAPDALPAPRQWQQLPDLSAANVDQYPAVIVTSPGLAGRPTTDGDGNVRATWRIQIVGILRGQSFDEVETNVGIYTAALRTCALQQGSFDDLDATTTWAGELYDVLDSRAARTLGAGQVDLEVTVGDVLDVIGGPLGAPPVDPLEAPVDDPTVVTATVAEEPLHPVYE